MKEVVPDVFQYTSYRSFLKDYFRLQKEKRRYWSHGTWARELRLKSPSTLIMILNGQRNPGPKLTEKLINQLGLGRKQAEYFRNLVLLHKHEGNVAMTVLLMEKLALDHRFGPFFHLSPETFSAISNWYYYATRQMVRLPTFREDYAWISRHLYFKVTPKQVRTAVKTLLHLQLLERDASGKLQLTERSLDTRNDVADEGLKRFHEQVFDNFKLGLRKIGPEHREVAGVTFAMKRSNLGQAKALIRKFQRDFCELLSEDDGDGVYHLETGFFPLSRSVEDKDAT